MTPEIATALPGQLRALDNASNGAQPYAYPPTREFIEPDWRRLPGYATVTEAEWASAKWQRLHTVKNLDQLQRVFGDLLPADLVESITRDQVERATMSMLIPPQMLNTMDEHDLWGDPIRHYMIPAFADRHPEWPSHPHSERDSLHEADMWAVEGLTHRYPTKVLAELLATCPQYCGHCTRMDLVGNNVPQVIKHRFELKQKDRYEAIIGYLKATPSVRDVVVSGGDIANLPIAHLEDFVTRLIEIPHIQDIRLATKGLMGLPQHFLQDDVLAGMERLATKAIEHDVDLAIHTHVNHANSLTPLVATAVKKLLSMGFRDIRNQGVLMRGVNDSPKALLDLSFTLLDKTKVMPYYFYMCDMIPNAEHWRLALHEAQDLQHSIMGYLPGFATPRIVCDVPFVGKRWVHQVESYDRAMGISYWTKNYRTGIEYDDPTALDRRYPYYDPIYTLPPDGQEHWRHQVPASAHA
ncbi:MAG: lysine 2,3-aminomutase [Actinomycetota bacterium]|jgi:lysine 2,3-aminomutase|nr:lysine 2,3-aminomutase [Actinomycetota bacterium]